MKKKIFIALVLFCSAILIINFSNHFFASIFNLQPRSGLKVSSNPEAGVFINGLEVGKTPYQDENLSSGEYLVKLISNNLSWQGRIKLTKGTISNINRFLASNTAFESGESLVLDKGKGIIITSSPASSEIEIDGKVYGITPLSLLSLTPGEHTISLSHEGYVKRSINVILPPDASLNINIDLAMVEVKPEIALTPSISVAQKIIIKQTPLGYLRVREKPTISSKEIGQVSSGDELFVVEEIGGWVKVRLPNNLEGYVSTQYTQKKTQ